MRSFCWVIWFCVVFWVKRGRSCIYLVGILFLDICFELNIYFILFVGILCCRCGGGCLIWVVFDGFIIRIFLVCVDIILLLSLEGFVGVFGFIV